MISICPEILGIDRQRRLCSGKWVVRPYICLCSCKINRHRGAIKAFTTYGSNDLRFQPLTCSGSRACLAERRSKERRQDQGNNESERLVVASAPTEHEGSNIATQAVRSHNPLYTSKSHASLAGRCYSASASSARIAEGRLCLLTHSQSESRSRMSRKAPSPWRSFLSRGRAR
jgi:hypothetical protein